MEKILASCACGAATWFSGDDYEDAYRIASNKGWLMVGGVPDAEDEESHDICPACLEEEQ